MLKVCVGGGGGGGNGGRGECGKLGVSLENPAFVEDLSTGITTVSKFTTSFKMAMTCRAIGTIF